jgi:tetratricopeptide (TPR) repeat protein
VAFFGTPSGGLTKARFGWFLKQQARDMARDSPFVTDLRREWSQRFDPPPFRLLVVAGERDQFVPPESSLAPFPEVVQRVVPGNHLEIVKPRAADDRSVQLLVDALLSEVSAPNVVDSARVAVERGRFKEAVDALLPRADRLDGDALVQLSLALDTLGRSREALDVLEQRYRGGVSSTDAVGVLAGRLKRRWLVNREQSDWTRAHDLYAEGLRRSTPDGGSEPSNDQAMYHAINLAFLELMITPTGSPVPVGASRYARDAHAFATAAAAARRAALPGAGEDHWQLASIGDALAIDGRLDDASAAYAQARKFTASPREIDSMYGQALLIAEHIFGQDGARAIEKAFAMNLVAIS